MAASDLIVLMVMLPDGEKSKTIKKVNGHYRTKKSSYRKLTGPIMIKKLTSIIICYRIIAFVPNTVVYTLQRS